MLLLDGTLDDILTARAVSREAMELVEHNFRTIVAVNSAALLLAMTGAAPPVFSATIHNMSTIIVGLRSLHPPRKEVARDSGFSLQGINIQKIFLLTKLVCAVKSESHFQVCMRAR